MERHANLDIAIAPWHCVELHIRTVRFQMQWTAFYRLPTCLFDEIHASLCPPLHSIMFNVTRRAWLERNRELMYICISTLFILRQTQWRHTVLSERALYWMQWRGLPCDSFSFRLLVLYDVKSQDSGQKCQPMIYTGIFQIFLGFSARITQHTLWRNLNLSLAFDPWCC